MSINKTAENIWSLNKLSGSLSAWQISEVKRMIRAGIRAGIRKTNTKNEKEKQKTTPR